MKEEKTLEEKNQEQKNQTLHNIMKEFDIYKWNSERRLAAINESVDEAKGTKYDDYVDVLKKWLKDAPQANAVINYIESNRGLIVRDMMSSDFDRNTAE